MQAKGVPAARELEPAPVRSGRGTFWWARTGMMGPVIAPILLAAGIAALNSRFLVPANLRAIAEEGAIVLVLSIGATYVIIMGSIDLSVGALLALGQVLVAILISEVGYWAFPIAIAIGFVAGLVNGWVVTRLRIPSFIGTLGMSGIWVTLALVVTAGENISVPQRAWPFFGWARALPLGVPTPLFVAAAVVAGALLLERRTRFGRYVYAIGAGEEVARLSGVPIVRVKVLAFGLASATAALAGALFSARLLGGQPGAGDRFLLLSVAVIVMGGTSLTGGSGGVLRTVAGALTLTILGDGMTILGIDPFVQQVITGVVVIAAVAATIDRSKALVMK